MSRRLATTGLRYLLVGGTSVAVYVGCAAFLHRGLSLSPLPANAVGYGLATALNYFLNFYWSFQTSRSHAQASWRFLAVVLFGLGLNWCYAAMMLRVSSLPVEAIAFSFAGLWPFISFTALRFWALR
jgi:putative flippase GtrA